MNVEKINALINHLGMMREGRFNMAYYVSSMIESDRYPAEFDNDCKTAACLAGHLFIMEHTDNAKLRVDYDYFNYAKGALDLTYGEADNLFRPIKPGHDGYSDAMEYRETLSKAQAIATLKKFRDTGIVDWTAPYEDEDRYFMEEPSRSMFLTQEDFDKAQTEYYAAGMQRWAALAYEHAQKWKAAGNVGNWKDEMDFLRATSAQARKRMGIE